MGHETLCFRVALGDASQCCMDAFELNGIPQSMASAERSLNSHGTNTPLDQPSKGVFVQTPVSNTGLNVQNVAE